MTAPITQAQRYVLDVLSMGRGRHAPMAYKSAVDQTAVWVYRDHRSATAFSLAVVEECVARSWVAFDAKTHRYRITPAGRAKRRTTHDQ